MICYFSRSVKTKLPGPRGMLRNVEIMNCKSAICENLRVFLSTEKRVKFKCDTIPISDRIIDVVELNLILRSSITQDIHYNIFKNEKHNYSVFNQSCFYYTV